MCFKGIVASVWQSGLPPAEVHCLDDNSIWLRLRALQRARRELFHLCLSMFFPWFSANCRAEWLAECLLVPCWVERQASEKKVLVTKNKKNPQALTHICMSNNSPLLSCVHKYTHACVYPHTHTRMKTTGKDKTDKPFVFEPTHGKWSRTRESTSLPGVCVCVCPCIIFCLLVLVFKCCWERKKRRERGRWGGER